MTKKNKTVSRVSRWLMPDKYDETRVFFTAFMPRLRDIPGKISVFNTKGLTSIQIWKLCAKTFRSDVKKRADINPEEIIKIKTDKGFLGINIPSPKKKNRHCTIIVPGIETREDLLDESKHMVYAQKLANISTLISR